MIDNLSSMLRRSCTHLKTIVFDRLLIGNKRISKMVLLKNDIEEISKYVKEKKDVAQLCSRIIGRHIIENNVKFDIRDFQSERNLVKYSSFADSVILNLICYELARSHRGIQEVYPALLKVETIPTLVCFLEEEIHLSEFRGFRLKTQMTYRLPAETTQLEDSFDKDSENYINVVTENFKDITETLAFHSQSLMSKHSNIEAVGVSFLKYNEKNKVEICPCIVIFCKLKSAIPYKESHFPRKLEHPQTFKSFRTDIRVGHFSLCPGGFASGRKGRYQEITMGCSIGETCTAYSASVGPFVNVVETNETCFLTVRHLFSLTRSDEEIIRKEIVQPADCDKVLSASPEPDRTCGKVIALVLSEEVDAALVQISEERKPTRGLFADITIRELADTGLSQTHVTTFDDGAQMDVDGLTLQSVYACRPVLKVGAETGLTKGFLATTSGVVKVTDDKEKLETTYNGRRESHYMTKLLFVESRAGSKVFCQPGDSGAGAFLLDSSIKLHCIGIVIGVLHNSCTVVTPIGAVLDAFKQKYPNITLELKKFNLDAMDTQ